MDNELLDPFVSLLEDVSPLSAVRHAEINGDVSTIWPVIQDSGFLDALIPEDKGGAGLSPQGIAPLMIACGEHLVPAPVAETIAARAIMAQSGVSPTEEPVTLWPQTAEGHLFSTVAPAFCSDAMALTQSGDLFRLVALEAGERDAFNFIPAILPSHGSTITEFTIAGPDLMSWMAAINAAYMAGAMNTMLSLSIEHANTRMQFGRPLAKFQVIQHQLAIMSERVAAANAAAQVGFGGIELILNSWRASVAKCLANEAAGETCAIAHAIHGAIGVSEEHGLQLYTRRIRRWQLSFGSESYWAQEAVKPWLTADAENKTSIDIIRGQMSAS